MRNGKSAQEGSPSFGVFKLVASALAVLLALSFSATAAFAQFDQFGPRARECDRANEDPNADTEGCLEQQGDNDAEVENDFEGTGGDGVAGSNVIGVAGSGDSNITADNNSRFARAEGGNVEANSNTTLENGPRLNVQGGDVNVTAVATGVSTVNQAATPNVSITLNQVASSTGTPTVTNTANSISNILGTNFLGTAFVSPTALGGAFGTGVGPVTQTLTQVANAPLTNIFAPVVSTTASNVANISGSAPVNQTGTAISNPTATATAGPNITRARLFQFGDNDAEVENDFAGIGGDGVAGSNVIGVAASGASTINATNTSEFARSEGGNVEFDSDVVANNGPRLDVRGGNTNVTAIATGIATVSQTAAPVVTLVLDQASTATGPSLINNTATSSVSMTGNNIINITGAGLVTPTGAGGVTPTATPITQILNQTGSSPVTNVFAPVVNTISTNVANVTGASPVTQNATATTNPTATATAGPNVTRGTLVQASDNDLEVEVDAEGVGGDAVAGSNVIGVAGAGSSTINATNNSEFARAEGGDTIFNQRTTANNGPQVSILGGDVNVTAIATGIANVVQTANPVLTMTVSQTATTVGPQTLSNSVSNVSNITGANVINVSGAGLVTGTGGVTPTATPINQTLNQTGGGAVNNTFAPVITTQSSNTTTVTGTSGVNQTAQTTANPTAIATGP